MILKKNIDSDPVGPVFAAHDNKRPSSAARARVRENKLSKRESFDPKRIK